MTSEMPLEKFIKKYKLNPTDENLFPNIHFLIETFQRAIEHPYFDGKINLKTVQNCKLLEHLNENLFKIADIQFLLESNSVVCTINEGKNIINLCSELIKHQNQILKQINEEKLRIWSVMEGQTYIDTRAIYQSCTADSKRAPIQKILKQIESISTSPLPNVIYAVENKITPTPVFVWSRSDMQLDLKIRDREFKYNFNQNQNFHHIPLAVPLETIAASDHRRFLIVENLDTAFALSFMKDNHNFDLVCCASGQGNAGLSFSLFVSKIYSQLGGNWFYFGDYDSNGFTIFNSLRANLQVNLKHELCFTTPPIEVYKKYLLFFGKEFPKDLAKYKQKKEFYSKNIMLESSDDELRGFFRLNLDFERELEQNILIYCGEEGKNMLII